MDNSRKNTFLFGLMLVFIISLFFVYQNNEITLHFSGFELKKNADLLVSEKKPIVVKKKPIAIVQKKVEILKNKRILLAGDSEAGNLVYEMQKYAVLKGHNLCRTIIWNSASDMTYASCDTLKNNIARYQPEYIIFVIGLNQVFQRNFNNSREAVNKILADFKDIPYTWVGPANWVKDDGINDFYRETVDSGAFYMSGNLELERGNDGRHPSVKGSKIWVDSICNFLTKIARYRIKMEKIDTAFKKPKFHILNMVVKSK